ncbi:peroxiredoxin-like family protein [Marinicellulosiphila megalodicopiae]|uniref:peroxiredoxin-like family protein n=1 Tax=Marinicellulosiphila megalodicopiae TaxID=2724896 RepID=UPI003BAFA09A
MSVKLNQTIENIVLPNIDGQQFELSSLKGKRVMVAFHRFATCPFCNLRIHQLIKNYDQFSDKFTIVAIFDSPLDHLQKHATDHHAPFYILADSTNQYYQSFSVERSVLKVIKGFFKHFPSLMYAMFIKGYWPFPIKGNVFSMPMELLINEQGEVVKIFKGQDEGDHLPIDAIKRFANMGEL